MYEVILLLLVYIIAISCIAIMNKISPGNRMYTAWVSELADFALDKAEEMGLTQREVEELPERIKALLKWDICWDDRKYVRHPRPVETRTRCIKNLW